MYSQENYPNDMLGTSNVSIKTAGCFLVSECNLLNILLGIDIDPPTLNAKLVEAGGIDGNGAMIPSVFAKLYGGTYEATTTAPSSPCIAETLDNAKYGAPTHFVVFMGNGEIIDPIDGVQKPNQAYNSSVPYNFVNYRIFNFPPMQDNLSRTIACLGAVYNKLADGSGTETPEQAEVTACAGLLRDIRSSLGIS